MSRTNALFCLFLAAVLPLRAEAAPFFYKSAAYDAVYEENLNAGTKTVESFTIFFKPTRQIYMTVFPYGERCRADAVVYGQRIYNGTVLPISWEKAAEKNFEDLIRASKAVWDWDLLLAQQNKTQTRTVLAVEKQIDEKLPDLKLADYKAMSETGKWIDIADGSEYSRALVNSFGFVKWIADGFYRPATGRLMNLNDLVLKHFEEAPNNHWLIKETFRRNPYFGLDWIKNIGLKLNRLTLPDATVGEIEVKSIPFYGFTETAGIHTSALPFVLYWLAAKTPSKFYLISYSSSSPWSEDRTLLEHSKTAVAFPTIDYRGLLSVAYYENGIKIPIEQIEERIKDSNISLVGAELLPLFHLPPVKNLSILYR